MMKQGKFFYHAALVFGLVAAAPVFAEDVAAVGPSGMTQQEREAYRTQRQSDMSSMTAEQRAEMQASHGQGGSAQGQGIMARDGSASGGQYGRSGGMGGGQGGGRGRGR
jgi:hypothetical protein